VFARLAHEYALLEFTLGIEIGLTTGNMRLAKNFGLLLGNRTIVTATAGRRIDNPKGRHERGKKSDSNVG
jgi:hypothetical protein